MKKIDDLRSALFEVLDGLMDKQNPLDLDRAKAVSDVCQVIINTAKVEVEFMRVTGGTGGGFIENTPRLPIDPTKELSYKTRS